MLSQRHRSCQILSMPSEHKPAQDVALTQTPVDRENMDLALDIILRVAVQRTDATAAAIGLMCTGTSELVCRARVGDIAPDLGVALNVDAGITGICVRTAQILHCHDAETDARVDSSVCRALGIRSILVVPIVVNGAVAGILETLSSNSHAFNSKHIEWLTRLSYFVHGVTCGTIAPSLFQKADPNGSLDDVGVSAGFEVSQGLSASSEDPGLTELLGAFQGISSAATWDVICEELASRFR